MIFLAILISHFFVLPQYDPSVIGCRMPMLIVILLFWIDGGISLLTHLMYYLFRSVTIWITDCGSV